MLEITGKLKNMQSAKTGAERIRNAWEIYNMFSK